MKHRKLLLTVVAPLILSSHSPAALVWTGLGTNPNDFYDNGNWDTDQMFGGPIVAGQPIPGADSQIQFVGATVLISPPIIDNIFEFQTVPFISMIDSAVTFQPGAGMTVAPRFQQFSTFYSLSNSIFTHTGTPGNFILSAISGVKFTSPNTNGPVPRLTVGMGSYFEATVGRAGLPIITNAISGVVFRDDWAAAQIRNPADPASELWNFTYSGLDPDPTDGVAQGAFLITAIEPIPEPATISLCGLALLAGCLRRKRQGPIPASC